MRLTVFGGTGPTGQLLIEQALNARHAVTAYARTPTKLPQHHLLRTVGGSLDDAALIGEAIQGSDAVLSLLGPSTRKSESRPLIGGYRHILAEMRTHDVERLVVMGTPAIPDPADRTNPKLAATLAAMRLVQRPAYETIRTIDALVRDSGAEWTIVRLPFLTNGPRTPTIQVGPVGRRPTLKLSRSNAAAYFLAQATERDRIHQAPFITDH